MSLAPQDFEQQASYIAGQLQIDPDRIVDIRVVNWLTGECLVGIKGVPVMQPMFMKPATEAATTTGEHPYVHSRRNDAEQALANALTNPTDRNINKAVTTQGLYTMACLKVGTTEARGGQLDEQGRLIEPPRRSWFRRRSS